MHSHSPALMRMRNCLKFKCAKDLEIFSYYCCKPFSVQTVGQKGLLGSSMTLCRVTQQGIRVCSTIQDKLGSLCLLRSLCSVRHPTWEYNTAAASPIPVNIQQLQQNYNSSKAVECQEILGKQAEHKVPFHL